MESLVSVRVREVVKRPAWRNGRFETREIAGMGAGSGVIIGDDGRILTSAHVVAGAVEVRVRHSSGREETARVIAIDEASDLALLRAPGTGYKSVVFSTAGVPPPGTPVFIAGNRGNDGPEIDPGRIGQRRLVRIGARPLEFWAEVEAPIGPGDSGGAVLNTAGELVGVPGLQIVDPESMAPDGGSPAGALQTSGLFIPAAHALRSVQRMSRGARPDWAWIGLLLEDPLLAGGGGGAVHLESGPVVRQVLSGSPAEKAGLKRGDRLTTIAGRPVRDNFEALDAVLDLAAGADATVEVERSGRIVPLSLVTGLRPDDPRPDPLDDFYLHTGIQLAAGPAARGGQGTFVLDAISREARARMTDPEMELFRERPSLGSLLPGAELLGGSSRRHPVGSAEGLAGLIGRCFVEDQFVALIHWDLGGGRTIDRAHVHRKIHPVII
jgi:S1-C subfamily serine protease